MTLTDTIKNISTNINKNQKKIDSEFAKQKS